MARLVPAFAQAERHVFEGDVALVRDAVRHGREKTSGAKY
jgi:hypothetical protein